jgi:hypothetical protein
MSKSADEFLYEYKVICEGDELLTFYSDATPPEVGTLLGLWEFAEEEPNEANAEKKQVPYRIIEVNRYPKKTRGSDGNVSIQMRVHLTVKKGR